MTEITLTHPIHHNGETITSLRFRRMTMGDIRAAKQAPDLIEAAIVVASRLAGVSVEALDGLDASDSEALFAAVNEKLAAFQKN